MTQAETIDERDHYCRRCARWLFATSVPLGTPGVVRLVCADSRCGKTNAVKVGTEPLPRPDRERWLRSVQLLRASENGVGTRF
jgi:hypothetical protein